MVREILIVLAVVSMCAPAVAQSSTPPSSAGSSSAASDPDRYRPAAPRAKANFEGFSQTPPKEEPPPTAVEKAPR